MDKSQRRQWHSSRPLLFVLFAAGILLLVIFETLVHDLPKYGAPVGTKIQLSEEDRKSLQEIVTQERVAMNTAISELSIQINDASQRQRDLVEKLSSLEQNTLDLAAMKDTLSARFDELKQHSDEANALVNECEAKLSGSVTKQEVQRQCGSLKQGTLLEMVKSEETALQGLVETLVSKAVALHSDTCTTREYVDQKWEEYKTMKLRDDVGMVDYALESRHAGVIMPYTSPAYTPKGRVVPTSVLKQVDQAIHMNAFARDVGGPEQAIRPGKARGECFGMQGNAGNLTIKLSEPVHVGAITLEHLNRVYSETAGDSALNDFKVFGYQNRDALLANDAILLLHDSYNIEAENPLQTFYNIIPETREMQVAYVRLQVLSNHGNEEFTCIYRFRVHAVE